MVSLLVYRSSGARSTRQRFCNAQTHMSELRLGISSTRNNFSDRLWPIATFPCAAKSGRYRGVAKDAPRRLCNCNHGFGRSRYPRAGPSRGPRDNSQPQKDPDERLRRDRHPSTVPAAIVCCRSKSGHRSGPRGGPNCSAADLA